MSKRNKEKDVSMVDTKKQFFRYINTGATRRVFLCNNIAIKIPTIATLELFLAGWLANMQEISFGYGGRFKELAPVRRHYLFGLVIIMERVSPVHHVGLFHVNLRKMAVETSLSEDFILSDAKPENFGYNKAGELVKCDYGE